MACAPRLLSYVYSMRPEPAAARMGHSMIQNLPRRTLHGAGIDGPSAARRAQAGEPGGGKSRCVSAGTVWGRHVGKVGIGGTLRLVAYDHMQEAVEVDKPERWSLGISSRSRPSQRPSNSGASETIVRPVSSVAKRRATLTAGSARASASRPIPCTAALSADQSGGQDGSGRISAAMRTTRSSSIHAPPISIGYDRLERDEASKSRNISDTQMLPLAPRRATLVLGREVEAVCARLGGLDANTAYGVAENLRAAFAGGLPLPGKTPARNGTTLPDTSFGPR